jgi:hypothetical protein
MTFNELYNLIIVDYQTIEEDKNVNLSVTKGEKLPVSKGAGLTAKGRAKYNRETGSNLKAPQPEGGSRKKSFCARSSAWIPKGGCGGKETRGCAARRRWKC